MSRVAYSEEDRVRIRQELISTGLSLMVKQGMQHTTVEQIYSAVGISRTFFYSFFPTREDLIMEVLYLQQPRLLTLAGKLMSNPSLSWREGITQFLRSCCYGEQNGILLTTVSEQQHLFRRLSKESLSVFRERQLRLFSQLLERFGILPSRERASLLANLLLMAIAPRHSQPDALPLFLPEAVDAAVDFQIHAVVTYLEDLRRQDRARLHKNP